MDLLLAKNRLVTSGSMLGSVFLGVIINSPPKRLDCVLSHKYIFYG